MTLLGEVTIPPNDRRGELSAVRYMIERADWLTLAERRHSAHRR
jgi:hypothetical protein